jgi:adenosylmethionine-8-amino-7-oxononanoate aminotransferase
MACLAEVERALERHADELAAVIMEPNIQGAGGMIAFPPGYTRAVWELAKKHQVLFIADEVATGFGRTGSMFACDAEGVQPDLMAIGKGMSGGYLPLAATLATEEIFQAFLGNVSEGRTFYHGHTYAGNPLACAAALASLDIFDKDNVLEAFPAKAEALRLGLEKIAGLEHVGDIRQAGLMVGIELVRDWRTKEPYPVEDRVGYRVVLEARKRGMMLRPLGDVIVLMPPLSVTVEEISQLLTAVYWAISAVTGGSVANQ